MEFVIASVELTEGNVLSFNTFPTQPYPLGFVLRFHIEGEVTGEIAYRVRKWEQVICQTPPMPFHALEAEGNAVLSHPDNIDVAFPGQGSYLLDVLFGNSLIYSLPFSVFDSSKRAELEREIIYYLKRKRGPRSVKEITRGVYNPSLLNKGNFAEAAGRVYLALLRMKEVINSDPIDHGTLVEKMDRSRWKLK